MTRQISATVRDSVDADSQVTVSIEDENLDNDAAVIALGTLAAETYQAARKAFAAAVPRTNRQRATDGPTSYASHDDPNYNSKTAAGCEAAGEPCFTLRAQDIHASATVRVWASLLADYNSRMAEEAENIAEAMDLWPVKKEPDL